MEQYRAFYQFAMKHNPETTRQRSWHRIDTLAPGTPMSREGLTAFLNKVTISLPWVTCPPSSAADCATHGPCGNNVFHHRGTPCLEAGFVAGPVGRNWPKHKLCSAWQASLPFTIPARPFT